MAIAETDKPKGLDAIIFIPGMGEPWEEDLLRGLGKRFARALSRNNIRSLDFDIQESAWSLPEPFGPTRYLILLSKRSDGQAEKQEAHLYAIDLPSQLTERQKGRSAKQRAASILFLTLRLGLRVSASTRRNTSLQAMISHFLGLVAVCVMLGALIILLITLAAGIISIAPDGVIERFTQWWSTNVYTAPEIPGPVRWTLALLATASAALAAHPRVRRLFDSHTITNLAFIGYAAYGEERNIAR